MNHKVNYFKICQIQIYYYLKYDRQVNIDINFKLINLEFVITTTNILIHT